VFAHGGFPSPGSGGNLPAAMFPYASIMQRMPLSDNRLSQQAECPARCLHRLLGQTLLAEGRLEHEEVANFS
jgi:hypothetical protein